ncbi:hypothetical protein Q1695_014801 [Nippostrongylus brasiliensis]|nr:hypothetical protein Q1695_014801 [Nippostrongylus brasiliensis]
MDYRKKGEDSGSSDEEGENLPLNNKEKEDSDKEDEGPAAKKAGSLWGAALMEESIVSKGSRITLDKKDKNNRVVRGVESYHVPENFVRLEKEDFEARSEGVEHASCSGDLFDDAPIDLECETALCERIPDDDYYPRGRPLNNMRARGGHRNVASFSGRGRGPPGRFRGGGGRGGYVDRGGGNGLKRNWAGKVTNPAQLLSASYSLETLMAAEFAADITLEQLGDEMAKAMGERIPTTVKSIVNACGMDKALALFEETRKVESTGGMMIENGQRRRTPGGVFISLFKLDPDISGEVKKKIFEETKQESRKICRARKKGRHNYAAEVAKLADLMKKEKMKEANAGDLKPLPNVEDELLKKNSTENVHEDALDYGDICDDEMES